MFFFILDYKYMRYNILNTFALKVWLNNFIHLIETCFWILMSKRANYLERQHPASGLINWLAFSRRHDTLTIISSGLKTLFSTFKIQKIFSAMFYLTMSPNLIIWTHNWCQLNLLFYLNFTDFVFKSKHFQNGPAHSFTKEFYSIKHYHYFEFVCNIFWQELFSNI